MWVDIFEANSKDAKEDPVFCQAEPVNIFEARLIVWKTNDVPQMDWEGCSDVYIRSYFNDPAKDKFTDTHWRNSDGKASFNWRNIFKLGSLQPEYKLTIQAWDRCIISHDVLIGEFTIDITPMFQDSYLTNRQFNLSKGYFDDYFKQKLIDEGDTSVEKIKFDGKDEMEGTGKADWQKFWFPITGYDIEKEKMVDRGEI